MMTKAEEFYRGVNDLPKNECPKLGEGDLATIELMEQYAADVVKNNDALPLVSVSLLDEAGKLVGHPATNISGSCDVACMEWQEKYERWRNER